MGKKKKRITPSVVESARSGRNSWLIVIILFAAVILSYSPAWNGRPIWDDDAYITKPELRSLQGLANIWIKPGTTLQYYPIVYSVFWLEYKIWGSNVLPYHLVNIFLHAFSAILLWRILLRLKIPGAWLAAGIFALHPVQVESVAWISELKNMLSGVFVLSSALLYFRFDESRKRSQYAGAFALFLLALLSKSVIATLPAALLVVFWWKRGKLTWKADVIPLLPFFVLGIGYGALTTWMEQTRVGAHGGEFALSFIDRCLISGRAFWFYLAKLFWPARLTFIYPRWHINQQVWWQYLFPLSALLLGFYCWTLRDRWRGPLATFLLFAGILFPALGFLNVYPFIYSYVADHFQYIASIAVITLAATGITFLLDRFLTQRPLIIRYAIPITLLLVLAALTFRQAHIYRDPETLYLATLDRNPDCWLAHNNIVSIYLSKGKTDEALSHAKEAVRLRPGDVEPRIAMGDVLLRKRNPTEAIIQYKKAVAIQPGFAEGYSHLGSGYMLSERYEEAITQYQKALQLSPQSVAVHNNLAWLLATCSDASLRDGPEAVVLAEQADKLSGGNDPLILHTLAAAYAQAGQTVKAMEVARHAKELADAQHRQGLVRMLEKEIRDYESRL